MNDWLVILSAALWLVGLALILGVFSYSDYTRGRARLPTIMTWRLVAGNAWTRVGVLLFCAGMLLDSGSWLERVLWALPALFLIYEWVRGRSKPKVTPRMLVTLDRVLWASTSNPIVKIAESVVRAELLCLGVLSLFFLFPTSNNVPVFLGLPALWVARRIARDHFVPRTPLDWPILLLMLMVLVSLYATFDVTRSLGHVAGLLFGIGLYYALVEWAATGKRLRWAVAGYAVAGAALALIGVLGIDWADKFPALSRLGAKLTTILSGLSSAEGGINSNELGGALIWVAPLQLSVATSSWARGYLSLHSRWLQRLALLFIVTVTLGTLLLTQSRGAWIGFFLGFMLMLGLVAIPVARVALAVMLAAVIALVVLVGPQRISDSLFHLYGPGVSITQGARSLQSRTVIWSHAVYGIEDFPLTGMGMDSFNRLVQVAYPTDVVVPSSVITHAHNSLLQVALDLGLPGLVAYLALWIIGAALAVFAWRNSLDVWGRAVAAGLGAGLLASFAYGLTDTVPLGSKPSVLFWGLLALLVALWQHYGMRNSTTGAAPSLLKERYREKAN